LRHSLRTNEESTGGRVPDRQKSASINRQGRQSWNTLASTPLADTIVPNLTLMTSYQFRVSVTVARTTGEWSQSVGLLVH
jgi:hypothetical protein